MNKIEEFGEGVILQVDPTYLDVIYMNLHERHQMMWDEYKVKGCEWTEFLSFLEARYKVAVRGRSFEETAKVDVDESQNETKIERNSIFSKSKHQNEVNLSKTQNDDKIEKEREKLWKARQCVYDGIKNNNYVSWSVKVFRAKLKKFLNKFQNQITGDEKEFWKEHLNITTFI